MQCRFNDACWVDDKLYASACNMNGLFSININTYEINHIMKFSHDSIFHCDLHSKIIYRDNTLFCIPLNGAGISVVHLPDYSFTFIDSKIKYVNAIIYNNLIYLIPYRLIDGIWEYSVEENILVKTNLNILNKKLFAHNDATTDWYGSIVVDDFLYVVINGTGDIVKVNLKTGENKLIQFKEANFANIFYFEEWFYITSSQEACIYRTRMKKDDLIRIIIPGKEKSREIYRVVAYDNRIICIPCFGNYIYQYDMNNDSFQILHTIENSKYIDNSQAKYAGIVIAKGKMILLPKGDVEIVELNMETIATYKSCFNGFLDVKDQYSDDSMVCERKTFNLADYIHLRVKSSCTQQRV